MTRVIKAHFDGRCLVPEAPLDLPRNTRLTITVDDGGAVAIAEHGTARFVARAMGAHTLSDEEAD